MVQDGADEVWWEALAQDEGSVVDLLPGGEGLRPACVGCGEVARHGRVRMFLYVYK